MATLPRVGEIVYACPEKYVVNWHNSKGERVDYRINIYFNAYLPSTHPGTAPTYRYENRLQRRWPDRSSSWVDSPLSAWWSGVTYTPQYFFSDKSPSAYGWRPTGSSSSSSKATTTATTSSGPSGVSNTTRGPGGPLKTNPPLHWVANGRSPYLHATVSNGTRLGLISVPGTIGALPGANYHTKWGFRFLYNPSVVSYSQDQSAGINPEQIASDPAKLLVPGATSYSLDLYLNRIPDLKKPLQDAKYYQPAQDIRELKQLWSRGTEYDLEYLYRVINGDPVNFKGWRSTAQTGYLYFQRVDLRLGPNFFIQGTVTHVDVKHVLMTELMIPTLTQISLTIQQLPAENQAK